MKDTDRQKRGGRGRKVWVLGIALWLGLLVGQEGRGESQKGVQPPRRPPAPARVGSELIGKPAPNFTLESVTGARYRLSDLKGKVVLIDFWHTY